MIALPMPWEKKSNVHYHSDAAQTDREWEDHKYIDKVTTKNGTIRYIYEDPNNGGRTTLRKSPAESGGKQDIDVSNKKVDRQKAENRSSVPNHSHSATANKKPSNIVEDGVKAVNSLLDLVGDTLTSSIDTALQGLNSLRGLGVQKGTVDLKKISDHKR